jgi:hypothetical protein
MNYSVEEECFSGHKKETWTFACGCVERWYYENGAKSFFYKHLCLEHLEKIPIPERSGVILYEKGD